MCQTEHVRLMLPKLIQDIPAKEALDVKSFTIWLYEDIQRNKHSFVFRFKSRTQHKIKNNQKQKPPISILNTD